MASKSKCKFVVYDTKDDHLPPEQRIVTTETVSERGWSNALTAVSETAYGLRDRAGKREASLSLECGPKTWEQMTLVYCAPGFFKGDACKAIGSNMPTRHQSTHELAGRRRRRRR